MLKMQEIREIIELIDQSSISEFVYELNGSKMKIKKSTNSSENITEEVIHTKPIVQVPDREEQREEVVKEVSKQEEPIEEIVENNDNIVEIVSPMVGTFYRKPSPESDPYVQIGDKVDEDSIVCIVEAMKLFNEIEAETSGEIVEVLVGDGELVEYGQVLFKVKTK